MTQLTMLGLGVFRGLIHVPGQSIHHSIATYKTLIYSKHWIYHDHDLFVLGPYGDSFISLSLDTFRRARRAQTHGRMADRERRTSMGRPWTEPSSESHSIWCTYCISIYILYLSFSLCVYLCMFMYVCIYIYKMYVYIYIHIYTCIYKCIWVFIETVYIYDHTCIYIYIYTYIYMICI